MYVRDRKKNKKGTSTSGAQISPVLLVNDEQINHATVIREELRSADRFVGMLGFAKGSASSDFLVPLEAALSRGTPATLAVGLSLFLTDPKVLRKLLKLSKAYKQLNVYISQMNEAGQTDTTFHPKIYAFQGEAGYTVVVGSANMTRGGLRGNHEASIVVRERVPTTFAAIEAWLSSLVDKDLIPIHPADVERYEELYDIHRSCRENAEKKAKERVRNEAPQLRDLRENLAAMRRDTSENGMKKQMIERTRGRAQALRIAKQWGRGHDRPFIERYTQLLRCFHSAGLERGKTNVKKRQKALAEVLQRLAETRTMSPEAAYDHLGVLIRDIPGAGPNLHTEFLHAANPKRFAVMNKRSVSVLRSSGASDMPKQLNKRKIDGSDYAAFCKAAGKIRRDLGLADFTELDALLNYVYEGWDK